MTIEESVSKMKHLKYKALQGDIIVHDTYSDDYGLLDESALTALDMAIASFEAWEAVRQEIKKIKLSGGVTDGEVHTNSCKQKAGVIIKTEVLAIIDKHMKEVTHDD